LCNATRRAPTNPRMNSHHRMMSQRSSPYAGTKPNWAIDKII
jgi:hypothetical protein